MARPDRTTILTAAEVAAAVASLEGWSLDAQGRLATSIEFGDFSEAFGFMTRVALLAERLDHHPDWSNSWNRVDVAITNHAAGGITAIDVHLATAMAALS